VAAEGRSRPPAEMQRGTLALPVTLVVGCAGGAPGAAPPMRPSECEQAGGWWHAGVRDGFCKHQMQGAM